MVIKTYHSSYLKGLCAEIYALCYLIIKGYMPIKWRHRNYAGEIDLIVKKKQTLIAVEVKYRRTIEQGLYAIHNQQKKRIRQSLEIFYTQNAPRKHSKYKTIRCDVCIIYPFGRIYHLINAF